MATDICPTRTSATLTARVHDHTRAVIDGEVQRLARRAPRLSEHELEIVSTGLDDLAESLFLARLHAMPEHTARLSALFGPITQDQS